MDTPAALLRSRIGRVRLRARSTAKEQAEGAIRQALVSAELEPPAFPPGALLLVRSVHLPVSHPRALERALRDETALAARHATLPSGGRVPPGAKSVLFRDLAQALEVFALSVAERRASDEWWWKSLWPGASKLTFHAIWLAHPGELPHALAGLETAGALERVAATLSAPAGDALLEATAARFGLTHFLASVARERSLARFETPREFADRTRSAPDLAEYALQRELANTVPVAFAPSVSLAVRLWLAACAGVATESRWVRSERLTASAVRAVFAAVDSSVEVNDAAPASRRLDSPAVAPGFPPAPSVAAPQVHSTVRVADALAPALPPVEPSPTRGVHAPRSAANSASSPIARDDDWRGQPAPPYETDAIARAVGISPRNEVVHTAFGGVFYLANVALALSLYDDFTGSGRPELPLPFWDFLAQAGERLLGIEERRAFRADALAPWLAARAGRAADEPWASDVPVPTAAPLVSQSSNIVTWDDWFTAALPGIARRIEQALGGAPATLLRQAGRVVRRPARVDVHFSLEDHPIEVRLAGLDRDPGWIPAAGTELRFVYE